jgi:hypothetical protein
VSRLGHVLVIAGLCAIGAALALNASAWPGTAVATVGAVLVAIEGLAEWAKMEANARLSSATETRLEGLERRLIRLGETLDQRTTDLTARVETAERRDALGRM